MGFIEVKGIYNGEEREASKHNCHGVKTVYCVIQYGAFSMNRVV